MLEAEGSNKKRIKKLNTLIKCIEEVRDENSEIDKTSDLYITCLNEISLIIYELKEKYKELKGSKYALLKNNENLTQNQSDKLSLIAVECEDLYKAYQFKERLIVILHMTDYQGAKSELKKWIDDTANSGIKECVEMSEKIKRHFENILRSIELKGNSARSEACNTTIKCLIRIGRGFRNINNLISLIYLKCSALVIPLRNILQLSPEQQKRKREHANDLRCKRKERFRAAV